MSYNNGMKIVIIGAGTIGLATARLLSEEEQDVILIDKEVVPLERAAQELDVATRLGSGTDWRLLEEITENGCDLLLALTDHDEINLTACAIVKGLSHCRTVARIRNWEILDPIRLDFGKLFAVDHFVSPERLAAEELDQHLLSPESIRVESHAQGAAQLRTLIVPAKWPKIRRPLSEIEFPLSVIVGLIARHAEGTEGVQVIFPHGNDWLEAGDEITVAGTTEAMRKVHAFFGITQRRIRSAFIIGGGRVGEYLAKILAERGTAVRLIDISRQRCTELSQRLPLVTVVHHDGTDLPFLQAEGIDQFDVAVAATDREEVNVLACLVAQEAGCRHVGALIASRAIDSMLKRHGIASTSPLAAAANRILSVARAHVVLSTSMLYGNRAKIMELKVSADSKLVGVPLADLSTYLPRDCVFTLIQQGDRLSIATGQSILAAGDLVTLILNPKYTEKLLRLF
jgi:trk system potassium uptake protein